MSLRTILETNKKLFTHPEELVELGLIRLEPHELWGSFLEEYDVDVVVYKDTCKSEEFYYLFKIKEQGVEYYKKVSL